MCSPPQNAAGEADLSTASICPGRCPRCGRESEFRPDIRTSRWGIRVLELGTPRAVASATMAVVSYSTIDSVPRGEHVPTADERIVMYHVSWDGFETFLRLRGDRSRPRVTYLDGALELMSPSLDHEFIKSRLGAIIEAYFIALGIGFNGFGSWTIKGDPEKAGVEPDECYVFGPSRSQTRPDLAIEVVWTSGGIDKLEVYRRLGVPEVWFWIDRKISIHALVDHGYETRPRSACAPALDFNLLYDLIEMPMLNDALDALRPELART